MMKTALKKTKKNKPFAFEFLQDSSVCVQPWPDGMQRGLCSQRTAASHEENNSMAAAKRQSVYLQYKAGALTAKTGAKRPASEC